MRKITITKHLDACPDKVWDATMRPALLYYMGGSLVRFKPITPTTTPEIWDGNPYLMELRLLGIIPIARQVVQVSFPPAEGDVKHFHDNGHSKIIRRWDHRLTVQPEGNGTRYTEQITIDAGALTLPIAIAAKLFYSTRKAKWRKLIAQDFKQLRENCPH